MAHRNGDQFDLMWFHIDLAHPSSAGLITAAEARMNSRVPGAHLSVNQNLAATEALVKVSGTPADFTALLPPPMEQAIIRTFFESDHHEAHAMVSTEAWAGTHAPW